MSPLVRSLLALGALLAAADAKVSPLPTPTGLAALRCTGFRMDFTEKVRRVKTNTYQFEFKASGDRQLHNIPNHCLVEGGELCSQTVEVCNEFNHQPKVFPLAQDKQSPVFAACPPRAVTAGECGLLTFHIRQECCRVALL